MSVTNFSQTYFSNTTVVIPATASNITITVAGAKGGSGGSDTNGVGGSGGAGRIGTFTLPSYVARTLTVQPGGIGVDGPGCFGRGTVRSSGSISGGGGGAASGCSGSGGGGGSGSAVFDTLANNYIIVAGGGGGGGGGAWNRNGANGNVGGLWTNLGTIGGGSNGNSASCDDGAGGGGGGGGASGGAAGTGGCDNVNGGGAGGGGGSGYLSSYATLTSTNTNSSGAGYVTVSYTQVIPQITSFNYTPNPQTSTSGTPTSTVVFQWQTVDAAAVSIDQNVGNVTANGVSSGSRSVNTDLQSISGTNSPATKTYTLSAINGNNVTTSSVTVQVYNDNVPNDFIVPSLFDVEPNTSYDISVGTITGIDMPTIATVGGSDGVQLSKNLVNYTNSLTISSGDSLTIRATSLPVNTDPNGTPNIKEIYLDIGPVRRYFQLVTREPDLEETFDVADNKLAWPFPKIDITPVVVNQYTTSPTTLTVDDIELSTPYGTELTVTDSEAQIRVKTSGTSTFSNWIYTRQYNRPTYPFGPIQQRTQLITNPSPTQLNTRLRGVIITKNTVA